MSGTSVLADRKAPQHVYSTRRPKLSIFIFGAVITQYDGRMTVSIDQSALIDIIELIGHLTSKSR